MEEEEIQRKKRIKEKKELKARKLIKDIEKEQKQNKELERKTAKVVSSAATGVIKLMKIGVSFGFTQLMQRVHGDRVDQYNGVVIGNLSRMNNFITGFQLKYFWANENSHKITKQLASDYSLTRKFINRLKYRVSFNLCFNPFFSSFSDDLGSFFKKVTISPIIGVSYTVFSNDKSEKFWSKIEEVEESKVAVNIGAIVRIAFMTTEFTWTNYPASSYIWSVGLQFSY